MGQFLCLPVELLALTNSCLWWEDVLSLDVAMQRNRFCNRLFLQHLPCVRVRTRAYAYQMGIQKGMCYTKYPEALFRWMSVRSDLTLVAIERYED